MNIGTRSRSRAWGRSLTGLVGLAVVGAACISSAAPAPAVRWFDPTSAGPVAGEVAPRAGVRVDSGPHLGREFVVRVAAHEVVFDGQHGWIAEPRQLVAVALERVGFGAADGPIVRVQVETFELDVTAAPRAHVRLVVQSGGTPRAIDVWAEAAARSPEAFAAAMTQALASAATEVAALVPPAAVRR